MLKRKQIFFNNLLEVKVLFKKIIALFMREDKYEVVILATPQVSHDAREVLKKCLGREVKIKEFYSYWQNNQGLIAPFLYKSIKDNFLEACQKAKAVILPSWVHVEDANTNEEEIAKIAADVAENSKTKIFAFLTGGTWETLAHKVKNKEGRYAVKSIYSFADKDLLKILQTS